MGIPIHGIIGYQFLRILRLPLNMELKKILQEVLQLHLKSLAENAINYH